MAGKKKEGIDALKSTTGGKRRDDRQVIGRKSFDPTTIDAKNALTVIYMLKSPEDNVILRAVASLEVFGKKDPDNFKLLCSLGIFEYLYPLINHPDNLVRRFTLKLIGLLSGLEEYRNQMLETPHVLETFVDIIRKESDVVLQEFAALTLAELSKDLSAASDLLKVDHCIDMLFEKILSLDPDIQKNCLEIMKHLLNDINGVSDFIECPSFDLSMLLQLSFSSYPTIQALVIDILNQLTSMCRNKKGLLAFRDAKGIETTLKVLEKEDWMDLHLGALDLMLNIVDSPELCHYLLTSGSLPQLIGLLETNTKLNFMTRVLGILARISQTQSGALALSMVDMADRFVEYLLVSDEEDEGIQIQTCLGIANMACFGHLANKTASKNPTLRLTAIIMDKKKSFNLRNMAAFALNVLSKVDMSVAEVLVEGGAWEELLRILEDNANLPSELCQNVIQVFVGISQFEDLKAKLINVNFFSALHSCLPMERDSRDPSVPVDALECLSEYFLESESLVLFNSLNGAQAILNCLRSRFASIREWAGYLTAIAAHNEDFIKAFIQKGGLKWMLKERNTMYSMPTWQSAIESIFSNFLPAKFAFTGRLDFQDITKDGFYVYSNPRCAFTILEELMQMRISPIVPVYVACFNLSIEGVEEVESGLTESKDSLQGPGEFENSDQESEKLSSERQDSNDEVLNIPSVDYGRNLHISKKGDSPTVTLDKFKPDVCLQDYLHNLKRKIAQDDFFYRDETWVYMHPTLIKRRVKLLADFVASEMTGPEPDLDAISPYMEAHLKEMRYNLGTNIIPLGTIRMGRYLERAMLFKVLADRIGLPCAFVRGFAGRAWIEIAIPVLNIEDLENKSSTIITDKVSCESLLPEVTSSSSSLSHKTDCFWYPKIKMADFKCLPHQFLKPNAVVDLIKDVGKIYLINSLEAQDYCGFFP